jgi:hypothetical protein
MEERLIPAVVPRARFDWLHTAGSRIEAMSCIRMALRQGWVPGDVRPLLAAELRKLLAEERPTRAERTAAEKLLVRLGEHG